MVRKSNGKWNVTIGRVSRTTSGSRRHSIPQVKSCQAGSSISRHNAPAKLLSHRWHFQEILEFEGRGNGFPDAC